MKKIILISSLLLLASCSSGEENEERAEENEESTAVEQSNSNIGELVEESYSMTKEELKGTFTYEDSEKTTEVSFDEEGTLKFEDNSDNLRYYVNEDYGRVVINSVVHRVNKMENGYELISIDDSGKRTNNDIKIISDQ